MLLSAEQYPFREVWDRTATTVGRFAVAGAIGLGVGAATGLATPAPSLIGPNNANVQIIPSAQLEMNAGPLGTLRNPAHVDLGYASLSLRVTVADLNEQYLEPDGNVSNEGWNAYARIISTPEAFRQQETELLDDLVSHIEKWTLFGGATGVALYGGLRLRRRQLQRQLEPDQKITHDTIRRISRAMDRRFVKGVALATGCALPFCGGIGTAAQPLSPDASLRNTVLAGSQTTGPLHLIVNNAVPGVEGLIKQDNEYYDGMVANTQLAFAKQSGNIFLPANDDQMIVMFGADQHDKEGMNRVIEEVARLTGAKAYISGGDVANYGLTAENYVPKDLAKRLKTLHMALIGVKGNHDSKQTETGMEEAGFTMLKDAGIAKVDWLTVMGSRDQRNNGLGRDISPDGPEGIQLIRDQGKELADAACEQKDPINIAVSHEPPVTYETANRLRDDGKPCAQLALSGHFHQVIGPYQITDSGSVLYSGGTVGGAKQTTYSNIGPLEVPATLMFALFDKTAGVLQLNTVTFGTDGSVQIDIKNASGIQQHAALKLDGNGIYK